MTTPMCTTTRVWEKITAKLNPPNALSYTPLWGNPRLHHLLYIPDPAVWVRYDLKIMQQIMPDCRLLSYDDLKNTFQLPTRMFFATCNCDMRYKPNSPLKSICSHMLWSVFLSPAEPTASSPPCTFVYPVRMMAEGPNSFTNGRWIYLLLRMMIGKKGSNNIFS